VVAIAFPLWIMVGTGSGAWIGSFIFIALLILLIWGVVRVVDG
jgi:hypothetical protein